MSLLRTLFIIAVIYLAVRFITRYVLPLLVKTAVKKAEENIMNKMDEMQRNNNNEGEISFKYRKTSAKNKRNKEEGEYVDYEEVK